MIHCRKRKQKYKKKSWIKNTREKSFTKISIVEVIIKHHKGLSVNQDPEERFSKNPKKILKF